MIGEYVIVDAINHSKVNLGYHCYTKEKVAVKILRKSSMNREEMERARREILIMQMVTSLQHPFITRLRYAEETEESFCLVMDYEAGGELKAYILSRGKLSEAESHKFFLQIISAVYCLHDHNIVHRDIKHQNILLDSNNNIKLIDFGLSNFSQDGVFRETFCGTPAYCAPEMILGNAYSGPEVDIWSLGVVLYAMLTGDFPFKKLSDIVSGNFAEPPAVSPDCVDLLKRLLTVDRKARLNLPGVIAHSWTQRRMLMDDPSVHLPKPEERPAAPNGDNIGTWRVVSAARQRKAAAAAAAAKELEKATTNSPPTERAPQSGGGQMDDGFLRPQAIPLPSNKRAAVARKPSPTLSPDAKNDDDMARVDMFLRISAESERQEKEQEQAEKQREFENGPPPMRRNSVVKENLIERAAHLMLEEQEAKHKQAQHQVKVTSSSSLRARGPADLSIPPSPSSRSTTSHPASAGVADAVAASGSVSSSPLFSAPPSSGFPASVMSREDVAMEEADVQVMSRKRKSVEI